MFLLQARKVMRMTFRGKLVSKIKDALYTVYKDRSDLNLVGMPYTQDGSLDADAAGAFLQGLYLATT